jgi:hypothetical protein
MRARMMMMEAARSSKTLVNFCQTTGCYNPEDSHLNIKMDCKKIECMGVNWIHLTQNRDQRQALVNMVMNLWAA